MPTFCTFAIILISAKITDRQPASIHHRGDAYHATDPRMATVSKQAKGIGFEDEVTPKSWTDYQ